MLTGAIVLSHIFPLVILAGRGVTMASSGVGKYPMGHLLPQAEDKDEGNWRLSFSDMLGEWHDSGSSLGREPS